MLAHKCLLSLLALPAHRAPCSSSGLAGTSVARRLPCSGSRFRFWVCGVNMLDSTLGGAGKWWWEPKTFSAPHLKPYRQARRGPDEAELSGTRLDFQFCVYFLLTSQMLFPAKDSWDARNGLEASATTARCLNCSTFTEAMLVFFFSTSTSTPQEWQGDQRP